MTKTKGLLFTAGLVLAMAFTFSCSSDEGEPSDGGSSSSVGGNPSSSGGGGGGSSSSSVGGGNQCLNIGNGTFTDDRDGKPYEYVTICSQVWMAENLNYAVEGSICYGDNSGGDNQNRCDTYGRLYNWTTAMNGTTSSNTNPSGVQGVCPSGWHLPSDVEWTVLTNYVEQNSGCSDCAGTKLKATSGWNSGGNGTDEFGFSALPGGGLLGGSFGYVGYIGRWWKFHDNSRII